MTHQNGIDLDDLEGLRVPLDDKKPAVQDKPDSEEALVMIALPEDEEDTIPNGAPPPPALYPLNEDEKSEIKIPWTPEPFSHEASPAIAVPEQPKIKEPEIGELETVTAPPSEHVLKKSSNTTTRHYPLIFFAYHLGMLAAFAGILALVLWQQNKKIKMIRQQVLAAATPAPTCICTAPTPTLATSPPTETKPAVITAKAKIPVRRNSWRPRGKKPDWMKRHPTTHPVRDLYTQEKGRNGVQRIEQACEAIPGEASLPRYDNRLDRYPSSGPPVNTLIHLPCPAHKAEQFTFWTF